MRNMMKKIGLPIVAIVILLLMVAGMAGLFSEKIQPGENPIVRANMDGAIQVTARQMPVVEKFPASIEATQATLISARLMARLLTVKVRAGDSVKRGDLLIELENSDIKAQVQQAEAQIRATTARLKEATQTLQRVQELQKGGVMSVADLDKAVANHETLMAEMAGARQSLEEAKTAFSYTQIIAPFSGRIVDRFAEPGDTAQPGSKLLALYNPLNLRVESRVREQLALNLTVGQPLKVEIPSLGKVVDAVIEERVPAADPGSRSFLVKAGVMFDDDYLPGMYARLLVPSGTEKQFVIPAERVVEVGQLNLVWVAVDGVRQRRFVRVGHTGSDGDVEILSGLDEGDWVLTVK